MVSDEAGGIGDEDEFVTLCYVDYVDYLSEDQESQLP